MNTAFRTNPPRFVRQALDASRAVRAMSTISDEIVTWRQGEGIPVKVKVTVDVESAGLAGLRHEQIDVLKENLNTLGSTDRSVE
jgi:hypothetical protein